MKRILCVLIATIWLCTCWAGNGKKPIVWEQPVAESNQLFNDPFQSRLNIYRVEFADDETRVFMHITFRPHYWVKFVKETYLLADGKKYLVKSCDGLKLDEKHYIPSSGKEDVVYLYMANSSPEESWKNIIKLYDLVGDNIAHYRLPAAQQSAIENYLNIHSFPSYRLFDKEGNLVDVKVDARQLDNLEKIIKKFSK